MKKVKAASLLLALSIGLVSCEGMNKHDKKDRGHPRRDSISQVEKKADTEAVELTSE